MKKSGFTLIELLIVVAIIAILAAIAVPNFLEAQTRAKVSRTTADMRTLATALELYTVDHNRAMSTLTGYNNTLTLNGPSLINSAFTGTGWTSYRFRRLTTPISYITTVFPDVFAVAGKTKDSTGAASTNYDSFDYLDDHLDDDIEKVTGGTRAKRGSSLTSGATWRVSSCGPDNIQAFGAAAAPASAANYRGVDYDATNGTVSVGDIVRVGGAGRPASTGALPYIDRVHNIVH